MMNENLKELMRESNYAAPEIAKRAQKLAELIVKECAALCEDHPAWTGRMIGEGIKQHFGIES
jgi:hypothetical protein